MSTIEFYLFYLQSQFTGYALIIRITAFVVCLLVLIYLFSMIRIFLIVYRTRKEEKRKEKFWDKYKNTIHKVLQDPAKLSCEDIAAKLKIKKDKHLSKWESKQMTELITNFRDENWHRVNDHNYANVLAVFSIIEFWEKKLRQNHLFKNKTALRKLSAISLNIPGSIIAHKVHTKNKELRKHAKTKYIKFSTYDGLKFLEDDFDHDFNALDGVRIHNALKHRAEKKSLPPIIRWVHTATNEKYRCFLIKEIGLFQQRDNAGQLLELFQKTKSFEAQAQIAKTLGMLNYTEAIPVLSNEYNYSPLIVQQSIVDAMGNFNTDTALVFLEQVYKNTHHDELLIQIVRNIYKIDNSTKTLSKLKQAASTDFEKKIFAYEEALLASI